ncbi:MAG: CvpA family protein [bacterium]
MPTWLAQIHPLDAIGVLFVIVFILIGLKRGFSAELAGSLAILGAIAAVFLLVDPVSDWLVSNTQWSQSQAYIAALFVTFVVVVMIVGLTYSLLIRVVKVSFIAPLELVGGAIIGGLRAIALVFIVVFLCQMSPYPKVNAWFGPPSRLGMFVQQHQARATEIIVRETQDTRATIQQHRSIHKK